jgi:bifunctional ADP-heptose synthase (sugar kinase/adenylyltransferase)
VKRVLVIGETCRDIFNYGVCNRLCPEAPVPIFKPYETIENPGMATNVQRNIISLGVKANLITNENWKNITKTRHIDQRTNHMFIRIDKNDDDYKKCDLSNVNFDLYDAIVISDYNKGFISEEDIIFISENHDCVFMDTKKILGSWCDKVSYIKINISEYKKTKHNITPHIEKKLIITLGSQGCKYNDIIYSVPRVDIKDTSGAGDTFVSGLVVNYIKTQNIEESIIFANECATDVVQRRGVGVA